MSATKPKPNPRTRKPDRKGRDKPLTVKVSRGVLSIEIGVATCAFAALAAPFAWEMANPGRPHDVDPRTKYKITSAGGFAVDVCRALTEEAEDGSSLLTKLLDDAAQKAIEDGAEHFMGIEEEE